MQVNTELDSETWKGAALFLGSFSAWKCRYERLYSWYKWPVLIKWGSQQRGGTMYSTTQKDGILPAKFQSHSFCMRLFCLPRKGAYQIPVLQAGEQDNTTDTLALEYLKR
jgi:hypothetical protein